MLTKALNEEYLPLVVELRPAHGIIGAKREALARMMATRTVALKEELEPYEMQVGVIRNPSLVAKLNAELVLLSICGGYFG